MGAPWSLRTLCERSAGWLAGCVALALITAASAAPLDDLRAGNERFLAHPAPAAAPTARPLVVVTRADLPWPPATLFDLAAGSAVVFSTATGRLSEPATLAAAAAAVARVGANRLIVLAPTGGDDPWPGLRADLRAARDSGRLLAGAGLDLVPATVTPGGQVTFGEPLTVPPGGALRAADLPLPDAVARVLPGVVCLHGFAAPADGDDRLAGPRRTATGAGFVIDAAAGHLVTAQHVVEGAARVVAVLADGRALEARLIGADRTRDVAVLAIPPAGLVAPAAGRGLALRPGEPVFAIGHPFEEFEFSVTAGVVSALGRTFETGGRSYTRLFQTDTALNRGSSGGPVANLAGEVVGQAIAIFSPAGTHVGVSFARPLEDVLKLAGQLVRDGALPYLGATFADLTPTLAADLRLPQAQGLVVEAVTPGGPAATAGLQARDRVTRVAGQPVGSLADLDAVLLDHRLGEVIRLELVRLDQTRDLALALGRRPPQATGGR